MAEYVGSERCATCHTREAERWRGSHHDLAMQEATPGTVQGDFADARHEHFGTLTRFFREGDRFRVELDGPDGGRASFDVAYTFGTDPLQQLLVRLPDGRLQALPVAWDTRPAAEGGGRWLHLHPGEATPAGDVLHWAGPANTWNHMCADCHSTNVEKGFDAASGHYASSWSEIDVGCEACHGPGSVHVAAATAGRSGGLVGAAPERRQWQFSPGAAIAQRNPAQGSGRELDTCAPCHARRAPIARPEAGGAFLDAYRPALLDPGLYFSDGQIQEEVYVWGSFLQSRMHAAGVVCSDCHDPHAPTLPEPDAVCSRCHSGAVFDTPEHHHHPTDSAGASCVACHMPERTYMQIDRRADHSLRVPRPDLAERLGVPDPCSGCHDGRTPAWAAETVAGWRGQSPAPDPHFGEALALGRQGGAGAHAALADLARSDRAPGIARASAVRLLAARPGPHSSSALRAAARDDDPLVRMAAAEATESLPPELRWDAAAPLLRDPLRVVRIEAARSLAGAPPRAGVPGERAALAEALAEYRAAQARSADRPESHVNLGNLHVSLGEIDAAESSYREALRVGPWFLPAYLNLADVMRHRGRDAEALPLLLAALEQAPENPDALHALGLLHVREGRMAEALEPLAHAARAAPERPRYALVYALAQQEAGSSDAALVTLEAAWRLHPDDRDVLLTLATLQRDAGDRDAALVWARRLAERWPDDPAARGLLAELSPASSPGP
jgi:tetratricopeptide (TPR) repeat protein